MSPSQKEKEIFEQLEELQQQIFAIQKKRWGALFYMDHQSRSQEDYEYYGNQAGQLEKEALALGETYAALLQKLREDNAPLVSFWASVFLTVHQESSAAKKTQSGWESWMIDEAIKHWQDIVDGTINTPEQSWNQPPGDTQEEIKRRLGW